MAVRVNRTPLSAVAGLAEIGGQASQARGTQQFERQQELQTTDIQARSDLQFQQLAAQESAQRASLQAAAQQQTAQIQAQQESQDNAIRQQIFQQENQSRLNREAQEHAFGLQNAAIQEKVAAGEQQQQEILGLWEGLRGQIDPVTFTKGLISIKNNQVPPLLTDKPQRLTPDQEVAFARETREQLAANLISPEEARARLDSRGITQKVLPKPEANKPLTRMERKDADATAVELLPDTPIFAGAFTDWSQEEIEGDFKVYLERMSYGIRGVGGREELIDRFNIRVDELNLGEGALVGADQYHWKPEAESVKDILAEFGPAPGASAAGESTGVPPTQPAAELDRQNMLLAMQKAQELLGPNADPAQVRETAKRFYETL